MGGRLRSESAADLPRNTHVAEELVNNGLFGPVPEKIMPYIDFRMVALELDVDGYSESSEGIYYYE